MGCISPRAGSIYYAKASYMAASNAISQYYVCSILFSRYKIAYMLNECMIYNHVQLANLKMEHIIKSFQY